MNLERRKVCVIGARESGVGAAKLIKQLGGIPFVSEYSDGNKLDKFINQLKMEKIDYELGGHSEKVFDCDLIVTSPGVPSDSEVLVDATKQGIKVISEIELASEYCKGKIIAITGTNGKTTTTSLANHVLNISGLKTVPAGNIGFSFAALALSVNENEAVALETSSFQLDFIDDFQPYISVILNITPDHLDRYDNSFDNYIRSKFRILKNQSDKNYFIYNNDDEVILNNIPETEVNKFSFSINREVEKGSYIKDSIVYFKSENKTQKICTINDLSIKGEHNIANALAVVTIAKILNLDNKLIKTALGNFPGVEHRMEFVRELNGIAFINDSKATNVDSVWYALRSYEQPLLLILGGKDAGNDYSKIKDLVINKVKKIYAIGSSANKIYDYFNEFVPVEFKQRLEDCVTAAHTEGKEGDVLLLSPACKSFDMFDNYEHRGKVFKEAVNKL